MSVYGRYDRGSSYVVQFVISEAILSHLSRVTFVPYKLFLPGLYHKYSVKASFSFSRRLQIGDILT